MSHVTRILSAIEQGDAHVIEAAGCSPAFWALAQRHPKESFPPILL
jgi:hypothetical protein